MRVSEIRAKQIRVNQGLGVCAFEYELLVSEIMHGKVSTMFR